MRAKWRKKRMRRLKRKRRKMRARSKWTVFVVESSNFAESLWLSLLSTLSMSTTSLLRSWHFRFRHQRQKSWGPSGERSAWGGSRGRGGRWGPGPSRSENHHSEATAKMKLIVINLLCMKLIVIKFLVENLRQESILKGGLVHYWSGVELQGRSRRQSNA